jgi:hypothetical protein
MMTTILLYVLVAAAIGKFWILAMNDRRERRTERVIRRVEGMLRVWAETWPDPVVRAQLLEALKR